MSKFAQDFSQSFLKAQYKLIDGHLIEIGKIDLQELYNSMLPNCLDSILKAFLEPDNVSVSEDTIIDNPYQSFEDLVDTVNNFAEDNNLNDLSFSEILNIMITPKTDKIASDVSGSDFGGDFNG